MDLQVSKDGGPYSEVDGDTLVWRFDNNNFSLKKRVSTIADTDQIGVYTFKYSLLNLWNDSAYPGAVENAFRVTIRCVVSSNVCPDAYNYGYDSKLGISETIVQPTFTA